MILSLMHVPGIIGHEQLYENFCYELQIKPEDIIEYVERHVATLLPIYVNKVSMRPENGTAFVRLEVFEYGRIYPIVSFNIEPVNGKYELSNISFTEYVSGCDHNTLISEIMNSIK